MTAYLQIMTKLKDLFHKRRMKQTALQCLTSTKFTKILTARWFQ